MPAAGFWLSWWHSDDLGAFELHSPWWSTGYRDAPEGPDGVPTTEVAICAAVRAADEAAAEEVIRAAYDLRPSALEFRFVEVRPEGRSPYCGRFRRADWMPDWPSSFTPAT